MTFISVYLVTYAAAYLYLTQSFFFFFISYIINRVPSEYQPVEVVSSAVVMKSEEDIETNTEDNRYDYDTDKEGEDMQPTEVVSSADVKIEKDDKYDYDTDKEGEDMQSSTVKLETDLSANGQSKHAITPSPHSAIGNVMEVDNEKLVIEERMSLPTVPIQPKERPVQEVTAIIAYNHKPTSRNIYSTPVIMTKHTPFSTCPELESYLVANEDGYLSHMKVGGSHEAANFNTKLTKGLMKLAESLNYIFDEQVYKDLPCLRNRVHGFYRSRRDTRRRRVTKKKKKSAAVPKTVSVTVHVGNDYGLWIVDGKSKKIVWIKSIEPNSLLDGTLLKEKMILKSINGEEYPDGDSFLCALNSLKGGNNVTIVASIPTREELKDFPTKSKAKSKRRTSAQANLQEPQATKSLAKRRKKDDGSPNFFSVLGDSPLPRRASSPTNEQLNDLSDAFDSKPSSSHPKKKKKKTMKTVVTATTPLGKAMIKTVTKDWSETQMKMFTFALDNGFCGEWEKVAVLVDSKSAAECEEYYNRHMKMKREVEKRHGGKWKEVAVEILDVPGDKAKVKKDDKEKKKKVIDLT